MRREMSAGMKRVCLKGRRLVSRGVIWRGFACGIRTYLDNANEAGHVDASERRRLWHS